MDRKKTPKGRKINLVPTGTPWKNSEPNTDKERKKEDSGKKSKKQKQKNGKKEVDSESSGSDDMMKKNQVHVINVIGTLKN